MDILTYEMGGVLYVNLTNRCSNDCEFCERTRIKDVNGYNLWLDHEPTAEEIIADMKTKDLGEYSEVVFCGWGEPTYRWDVIKEVSDYVHSIGKTTRINTNGQGNLICGYDITTEIAKYLDKVSISLNNATAEKYDAVCHSIFGKEAFEELQNFAHKCMLAGVHTTLSVVDLIGEDEVAAARNIAERLGVHFRVRPEIK